MIWHYYDSHYLLLNSYKMIRECWFLLFLRPLFKNSPKAIKHRHPNKSVGMGKITKINKHRAYVYLGVNSIYVVISGVVGLPNDNIIIRVGQ